MWYVMSSIRLRWSSLVILLYALTCASSASADEPTLPKIAVLVPAFEGKRPIAENISTLLSLHLWRTLRRAEPTIDENYGLKSANINWSKRWLKELSDDFAREEARTTGSQLVLWGTVEQYGPAALIQTALSIENRDELLNKSTAAIWSISRNGVSLVLGLPTHVVLFSPLTLSESMAAQYAQAGAVMICATKEVGCEGPALNPEEFAPLKADEEWIYGKQPSAGGENIEGWVYLPEMGAAQTEIVQFTGGAIAYLRGDYNQAKELFSLESGNALIRYNVLLFRGLAAARSGELDEKFLDAAHNVNPYSRYPIQALFMAYAMAASKSDDIEVRYSLAKQADGVLSSHKDLFGLNDNWYGSAATYSKGLFE
jgi:hypothetical protein